MTSATDPARAKASARPGRAGRRIATCLAVLGVAGCSGPPPVDEVIPYGRLPQGDAWCRLMGDEHVQGLLGQAELERVRQVGELGVGQASFAGCEVVWADEEEPVRLVYAWLSLRRDSTRYLDTLRNLRNMVGENDGLVRSGTVVEVEPGAYFSVNRGAASVFVSCDEGGALPTVIEARVMAEPTESGELWAAEDFEVVTGRLANMVESQYGCPGELRGLGAEDVEMLTELHGDYEAELAEQRAEG